MPSTTQRTYSVMFRRLGYRPNIVRRGITTRSGILHYSGHGCPSQLLLSSCKNSIHSDAVKSCLHFVYTQVNVRVAAKTAVSSLSVILLTCMAILSDWLFFFSFLFCILVYCLSFIFCVLLPTSRINVFIIITNSFSRGKAVGPVCVCPDNNF